MVFSNAIPEQHVLHTQAIRVSISWIIPADGGIMMDGCVHPLDCFGSCRSTIEQTGTDIWTGTLTV